ncbi:MAG: hypothetical protein LC745_00400, partial [Planctomycetia bacterium]|nr:hypothetical protein [Planctomycetia bacterium]
MSDSKPLHEAPVGQDDLRVIGRRDWLRIILSSIGYGVITADPNGYLNYLNPVAESLTGWSL